MPTTRAKSPKLGRNKSIIVGLSNSIEGVGSSRSSRVNREHDNDVSVLKKPLRKSLSSLHRKDSAVSKTEGMPVKLRQKHAEVEGQVEKDQTDLKESELPSKPTGNEDSTNIGSDHYPVQNNDSFVNSLNPEVPMQAEMVVGG